MHPPEARRRAHAVAAHLERALPDLLAPAGIGLAGALEQQLFFALRDGRASGAGGADWPMALAAAARAVAALGAAAVPRRRRLPTDRPVAVLVREPIHLEVLDRIASDLAGLDGPSVFVLLTGRATAVPLTRPHPPAAALRELLHPAAVRHLPAWQLRLVAGRHRLAAAVAQVGEGADGGDAELLARVALEELPRIGLAAAALDSAVRRLRPSLLAAFDEVGTWARIVPSVARRHGIGSLDIPHAEAADVEAIRGAGYDRMAVYGPRAAGILATAGIEPERIVQVGAPRFDPLAGVLPSGVAPAVRRVVFAAQYAAGALTDEVERGAYLSALAAAAAVAPAELVVRPHPARPTMAVKAFMRGQAVPAGVTLRIEAEQPLQELLRGAWLMVTVWSNSVFEAALLGVPSITVIPPDVRAPVDFAADGLALGARDAAETAVLAERLRDPAERQRAVELARERLAERIGPADGRASERVARLMRSLLAAP